MIELHALEPCKFRVPVIGAVTCSRPGMINGDVPFAPDHCVNCGVRNKEFISPFPAPSKPRMSIDELATKRRRCGELKAAGQECHEFAAPVVAPAGVGIVVGCYQWPQLARLQIHTIREMCGPVPILIADDGSPADFASVCASYPDVTLQSNSRRMGHYAGDLSVFRKGIEWANARNFAVLVKLSQRLLITRRNWLAEIMPLLAHMETVVPPLTAGREAALYFRTEAVAMRVREWFTLARPKLDGEVLSNATELRFNDIIVNTFGGRYAPWPGFATDRNARTPSTIWHASHNRQEYVAWAARYGITLEDSFYTTGHQYVSGWLRG